MKPYKKGGEYSLQVGASLLFLQNRFNQLKNKDKMNDILIPICLILTGFGVGFIVGLITCRKIALRLIRKIL